MTVQTIRFQGRLRSGTATNGLDQVEDLADWTKRKFNARWKALEVKRLGDPTVIAAIEPHPDTGLRTWWAEGETS